MRQSLGDRTPIPFPASNLLDLQEKDIFPPRLLAISTTVRWGIGARLGIAFTAVVALAIAANLFAEHEISIIRTTRIVPVQVPVSPPRVPAAESAPPAAPVSTPEPAPRSPPPKVPETNALIAAVAHYTEAVRSQVLLHNEESDTRLDDTAREMQSEIDAYLSEAASEIPAAQLRTLRAQLESIRSRGEELSHDADVRQDTLNELSATLESMDRQLQTAMDRAWKILGRVIARKSLVDLKSSLESIHRRLAEIPSSGEYDAGALEPAIAEEAAFNQLLSRSAHDLSRSQGEAWVTELQSHELRLSELQTSLVQMDEQRRAALDGLEADARTLIAFIGTLKPLPRMSQHPVVRPRPSQPAAGTVAIAEESSPFAAVAPIGDVLGAPALAVPDRPVEQRELSALPRPNAALIGWISAAVIVLMLLISVWTVRSIVGPVRRMRSALQRIAAGESEVKVARGGIQELDDLAVSLNKMAEKLAAAQALAKTHQDHLEAKVVQRTRELRHLAEHDPLTQLPNRRQLFSHLKQAIEHARSNHTCVGVFFLDLDNFKNINDSMGHAFGDSVLEAVASLLRETAGFNGFAARLGGDEFTVVCEHAPDAAAVRSLGWELVRAFQRPLRIGGRELTIGMSAGASIFPDHGGDAESLLRASDAALFRAKALGRGQLTIFSPELLEEASIKFGTEQGLRRAIERGEFELVFQPEIDASTLETHLVEALLRWRLPDGRLASPAEFLGVAEESGLIMDISDWTLRTAIERAASWHHGAWPDARVAVNLSSRQLLDGQFVDRVMDLLKQHRLPPHCIEIELSESVLQTGAETIEVLRCLRANGLQIALDDFGAGYSSLASLERLPLTRVKLDRSLIASIHTGVRPLAIARAIIGLCHSLNLKVTAEGIETAEQLHELMQLAPITLQGYLLARPTSADKLLEVVEEMPEHMQSLLLLSPPRPQHQAAASNDPPLPEEMDRLAL